MFIVNFHTADIPLQGPITTNANTPELRTNRLSYFIRRPPAPQHFTVHKATKRRNCFAVSQNTAIFAMTYSQPCVGVRVIYRERTFTDVVFYAQTSQT